MTFARAATLSAAAALSLTVGHLPAAAVGVAEFRKAYVSNTGDGTITVVDLDTFTQLGLPIDVGNSPRGSAVHPDRSKLYVVNQHAEDLMVIDTLTDAVTSRTPVGGRPFRCGVSPDGTAVYAACHTTDDVWKLDTAGDTAALAIDFGSGGTQDVRVTPDGSRYLAMNNDTDDVVFVDASDDQQIGERIVVGDEPHSVAFSVDGATAIVVGEGETYFIDVATRTVTGVFPASGEHEEVRVFGNLAYATNLAWVTPVFPVGKPLGGPRADVVPGPVDGDTTIDIFDMTARTYLRSIVLGGLGANGLDLSEDGTRAYVTMRTSNELREVDLVAETETGRTLPVGAAPRSVSVVTKSTETPVDSYFLPRAVNVKLAGAGKDALGASGFYDVGSAADVDYSQPVTIEVGGFSRTFTLIAKGAGFVSPKDPVVKFSIAPNLKGSSRGKFKMKVSKATLGGQIDTAQPVAFHFRGTGLADAAGTVKLTAGRYKLGKARGALVAPFFFPQKAKAKVAGADADGFSFTGGFATDGQTPAPLGTVRFAFGPDFSRTIAGDQFTQKGDVFRFRSRQGASSFSITVDFLREVVVVTGKKVELGDLAGATTDFVFDAGNGAGAFRNTVRLGVSGATRGY